MNPTNLTIRSFHSNRINLLRNISGIGPALTSVGSSATSAGNAIFLCKKRLMI